MKKILSLILAGLMVLSCAAFVAADETETEMTYEDYAIDFLFDRGIYKGKDGGDLAADDPIVRYQMAIFAARLSTGWLNDDVWEDDVANDSTFKDLDTAPASDFLGAISYANQNGIVEGYNADEFGPYDQITYRDCLTMIVRTLGYKGLTYPWGYIEKAVELDLNVLDVPYTKELTRGQVASILYKALFANTKSGETLAKSVFGYDYSWKNIVIVASDKAIFADANGVVTEEGFVAFKVLNDDNYATLSAKTYYVKASELGIDVDKHEDELAVGDVYTVLADITDDIVAIEEGQYAYLGADEYLWNFAGTNTTDINKFMEGYQLVSFYNYGMFDTSYITDKTYAKNPIMLFEQAGIAVVGEDANKVAVDVTNMNILVKDGENWTVAWFYNPVVGNYWKVAVDLNDKVVIDWMSEEEFDIWYAKAIKVTTDTAVGFKAPDNGKCNADIYAKLEVFDLNEDGIADRALLKNYDLGWVTFGKADGKDTIAITGADTSIAVQSATKDFWLNVREDVTTLDKSGKNLVVYNWNKTSGELEIIKHIVKNDTDMDNNFIKGVLKGYSVKDAAKPYIVVDGTKYDVGYAGFKDDLVEYGNTNTAEHKIALANAFDALLLQYVELTIVDGKVINVEAVGDEKNVIITLGYAGITADGYIAVYGYKTNEMSSNVQIFKIASYNGWKKGDYTYYSNNYSTIFNAGTLLNITSTGEDNAYNVYVNDTIRKADDKTFEFVGNYRKVGSTYTEMKDTDKYLIITDNGLVFYHAGIVKADWWKVTGAYTDVDGVHVFYLKNTDVAKGSNKVLGFNEISHNGRVVIFEKYDNNVNLEAWYNDAAEYFDDEFLTANDYLLGATQTTAVVLDLLTGERSYAVVGNNIDLVPGAAYTTLGKVILGEFGTHLATTAGTPALIDALKDLYIDLGDANYAVGNDKVTNETYWWRENYTNFKYIVYAGETGDGKVITKKIEAIDVVKDLKLVGGTEVNDTLLAEIAKSLTKDIDKALYYYIDKTTGVIEKDLLALEPNHTYKCAYVYDVNTKKIVVYVWEAETKEDLYNKDNDDAFIVDEWNYSADAGSKPEASLKVDVQGTRDYTVWDNTTTQVPSSITAAKVETVTLSFESILNHGDLAAKGYLFGIKDHEYESFFGANDTRVRTNIGGTYTEYPVTALVLDEYVGCDVVGCDMVNSVSITLNKSIALGSTMYVDFYIYGGIYGNDIIVSVAITADATTADLEAELAYYEVNGTKYPAAKPAATLKFVSLDSALND